MNILAIESSCDETAAAVVKDGIQVLGSAVASSTALYQKYGGIVPEIAAREQLKSIIPVIDTAIQDAFPGEQKHWKKCIESSIDAIAVTVGPGLIGSLVVGIEAAKVLAYVCNKPIIPVNHVLAHMYANFVNREQEIEFPSISLVTSGGHTELFLLQSPKCICWLGGTIDDAAGEAFDKTARLLGFGSGGGFAIQQAAEKYIASKISLIDVHRFPRPLMHDAYNFSFSGLKTAVMRAWESSPKDEAHVNAIAYEVQESICDVLVKKTLSCAQEKNAVSIMISGGVAANNRLREKFGLENRKSKIVNRIYIPPISLCTDNAITIGSYAFFRGMPADIHSIIADPNLSVEVNDISK